MIGHKCAKLEKSLAEEATTTCFIYPLQNTQSWPIYHPRNWISPPSTFFMFHIKPWNLLDLFHQNLETESKDITLFCLLDVGQQLYSDDFIDQLQMATNKLHPRKAQRQASAKQIELSFDTPKGKSNCNIFKFLSQCKLCFNI